MIRLDGLTLHRGARPLLVDVSLSIHAGERVGLVGANGAGKSSLFALLMGELLPEAGRADVPAAWTVAHVAQHVPVLERAAVEFVVDGDAELRAVEQALATVAADDGERAAELHARYAEIGGHAAAARAATLMRGLGFAAADATRPVADFSGGWRVRLQLARALMCRSDLLLLDEPTNHLDLDAIVWLERWLATYPGTLIVISHDREFLDRAVRVICHLEGRTLRRYSGGWSDFERIRAERLAGEQALRDRLARERAHMQSFVDRFRAKATKSRQAQSRLKALARLPLLAELQVSAPVRFAFADPGRAPDPLIALDDARAAYGDVTVLDHVRVELRGGARVGVLGRNGAGKSTLVKLLTGDLPPASGRRLTGREVRIGYFAQHQIEHLRADASPLEHLQRLDPQAREQTLRDVLGRFAFHGDMATAPVAPLSGGEKARLALALIVHARPHVLLLDEPTNHLDTDARDALTLALQDFEGAVLLVSHDRALLRACADVLWLVEGGTVGEFDGDLEDYRQRLERGDPQPMRDRGGVDAAPTPAPDPRTRRREEAEARQRLQAKRRPLEQRLAKIEAQLETSRARRAALESALAAPDIYD
ncbi:MAG: ATP-binding cassette domain-containing protein, partial [Burkholderiales bacterium]|nr:ATP-binding cassette domain-containing protein [Burkholderiales bacterium]